LEKRNKTDLLIARELFQQAVTKDKGFAIAYAGLSDTYLLSSYRGYEDPEIMLRIAKKHIEVAIGLNAASGEILATLGYWHHQTFNWKEAEKAYRKSISLNPNQSNVYLWLAILLEGKEEQEEVIKMYNQGCEINPAWDYLLQNKIRAIAKFNMEEEAIRLQKNLIAKTALDPVSQKINYTRLSKLYWVFGRKDEALTAAGKAINPGLLRFYTDGDCSLLEKNVDDNFKKLKESGEYISELWIGLDYAKAGAREKAIACFNKAIIKKESAITQLLMGQYEFLNIKYISLVQIKRKIKSLISF
jgi:tetratricopeptide (TPR) repeat protein